MTHARFAIARVILGAALGVSVVAVTLAALFAGWIAGREGVEV